MEKKKKIIIYKAPLYTKIFLPISAIFLTSIPLSMLLIGEDVKMSIFVLICLIIFDVFLFFDTFNNYICLDILNKKVIVKYCFKKEEFTTVNLINFEVVNKVGNRNFYTLDINYVAYNKQIDWSSPCPSNRGFFVTNRRQRQRLVKFCDKCNKSLKDNQL